SVVRLVADLLPSWFFFSSRRRHTRSKRDWSSDVCSSDLASGAIFLVLLSALFVPPEATILPLFQFAAKLGWVDTHYPLVVFTAVLITAPIATFVMRQTFITLPAELGEAATVDGSKRLRTMLQIYLPLARPSLASVVVLSCWYSWNQFLEPLIYVRTPEKLTVPVALTHYE